MWQARYLPYGEVASVSGLASLDYRFPGQWLRLETGLLYNWHRHYDATTGRYVQPDPLGMSDGGLAVGGGLLSGLAPLFCPAIPGVLQNDEAEGDPDSSDTAARPPTGSRGIDKTKWSGNHREI